MKAHRLTTIRNADTIYVLDKGRLVECGSHEELMKKVGIYHSFIEAQNMGLDKANVVIQQEKCNFALKYNFQDFQNFFNA
jgi:ABC-type multidrug transport system ATPase subunit